MRLERITIKANVLREQEKTDLVGLSRQPAGRAHRKALGIIAKRDENGIFVAPFEQGEIGPDLFRHACLMGLEGMVSKRRDRPYLGGRSRYWIKVKNPDHPAYRRVQDQF